VCFEVVLAEGGTSDCRKPLFFSKPLPSFKFSNTGNRSEKGGGREAPQSPSLGLLCFHPQDRLSVKTRSYLRRSNFSTHASRIRRALAEAC